jgi:hypothetical protein
MLASNGSLALLQALDERCALQHILSNVATSACTNANESYFRTIHMHTAYKYHMQAARRKLWTEDSVGFQALAQALACLHNIPRGQKLCNHLLKPPWLVCSLAHSSPSFNVVGHSHRWIRSGVGQTKQHVLAQECCLLSKKMGRFCVRGSHKVQDPLQMML